MLRGGYLNIKSVIIVSLVFVLTISPTANAEKVIVVFKDHQKVHISSISQTKQKFVTKHQNLLKILNKYKIIGEVNEIKLLWVANSILLNATHDVIEKIKDLSDIVEIIPDYRVKLLETEDVAWNLKCINVSRVWSLGINGSGVKVAVVDTGIAPHPDLKDRIVAWKDFVRNESKPYDDNGHGTHVAGIIAGKKIGVAPGVSLIGVKVFNSDGSADISTIIEGFQWAVEEGAKVISFSGGVLPIDDSFAGKSTVNSIDEHVINVKPYMDEMAYKPSSIVICVDPNLNVSLISPNGTTVNLERLRDTQLGSYCYVYISDTPLTPGNWKFTVKSNETVQYRYNIYVIYPSDGTSILDITVNNLVDRGVVVVCAAGNEGYYGFRTINSPASAKKAIAVGAVNMNNRIAWFSSKGPVGYGVNTTIKPDVVAPGENIDSTSNTGSYVQMSGTSMATPHVSGVIALMLQVNPNLSPEDIKRIIEETALDLGEVGKDNVYGAGLVNAYYAVLNSTIKGDLNLNGEIDVGDLVYVARIVVGKMKQDKRADFNGNGRVDIGDLAKIAYYLIGKINQL